MDVQIGVSRSLNQLREPLLEGECCIRGGVDNLIWGTWKITLQKTIYNVRLTSSACTQYHYYERSMNHTYGSYTISYSYFINPWGGGGELSFPLICVAALLIFSFPLVDPFLTFKPYYFYYIALHVINSPQQHQSYQRYSMVLITYILVWHDLGCRFLCSWFVLFSTISADPPVSTSKNLYILPLPLRSFCGTFLGLFQ